MNLYTTKNGKKIICFSKSELMQLYKANKQQEIRAEIAKSGFSIDTLGRDRAKMEELAGIIGERGAQHRDEHEVFASLFAFPDFYGPDTEICYELKDDFVSQQDTVSSLADLYNFRKVDSDSDFLLRTNGDFRNFQLKRYRGELTATALFEFIAKKVQHYSNNLGDTNLLIQLQAPAGTSAQIDFHELHRLIQGQNFKFDSAILISYNENDKRHLIITVHPTLGKTEIPVQYPSTKTF
jgi:hypothetical protein